jgi:tRNA U38,U39,U40 pseudouridine synthase TruA
MNITLKMQVFFIENSTSFEDTINEYHENLNKKTSTLVKEIIEGAAKSKDELVVMQKKIIVDIVLQAALGSPSNQEVGDLFFKQLPFFSASKLSLQVMTEISKALNSIMTEKDFENFAALESHQRMESLREIRSIVCGIVLFNKDTGIGNTTDIPDCKLHITSCLCHHLSLHFQ